MHIGKYGVPKVAELFTHTMLSKCGKIGGQEAMNNYFRLSRLRWNPALISASVNKNSFFDRTLDTCYGDVWCHRVLCCTFVM